MIPQHRDDLRILGTPQFRNIQRGYRGVASPQRLGVHDIVEPKLMYQRKHTLDVGFVHTGKSLIQRHKPRGLCMVGRRILGRQRRKQRHIHGHRLLATAEAVEGRIGQLLFGLLFRTAFLVEKAEGEPVPEIQRLPHQLRVGGGCSLHLGAFPRPVDFGAEMIGDFLPVRISHHHGILTQQGKQFSRIQLLLLVGGLSLPHKAEPQSHGGIQLLHNAAHPPGPFLAVVDAVAQLGDDRLVENRFEQTPVFLGEELFFHIPLTFQPPNKIQQIQSLAVQVEFDTDAAAQPHFLTGKQRLGPHTVGIQRTGHVHIFF